MKEVVVGCYCGCCGELICYSPLLWLFEATRTECALDLNFELSWADVVGSGL